MLEMQASGASKGGKRLGVGFVACVAFIACFAWEGGCGATMQRIGFARQGKASAVVSKSVCGEADVFFAIFLGFSKGQRLTGW